MRNSALAINSIFTLSFLRVLHSPIIRFAPIFLLGFASVSAQSETATGDLKTTVMQALETSPEVQSTWHLFQAATEDVAQARSGYKPSVDISAATGKTSRDYDGRGNYTNTQAQLTLTQTLFDGFRTRGQVEYFNGERLVRYYELLSSLDSVALDAVIAYQDVKRTRELVELARANYAKHRDVYGQIEERTISGVGRRVDLEQVAGRLALAESNLLTEAANLHDVTARYLRIVGQLPAADLKSSALSSAPLPENIRIALQLVYEGNPSFHAAIKNITAAQANVKVERAGYYPKAELRARQVTSRNQNGFDERVDPSRYGDESAIELALTYNLYSGGANRAAVRRSLALVDEAKDRRDLACVDLRQNTQIAYNDTQRLKEQLLALQQHRIASDKVRTAYSDQFNIGQRTLLDLLDAENEYFQASRSLVVAQGDIEIAYARALTAMGKLLPVLGVVREGLDLLQGTKVNDSLSISNSVCPDIAPIALGRDDLISEVTSLSGDALFDLNSSSLKASAQQKLDVLIASIKATPKVVNIGIEGHTDSSGSDALNARLSDMRAQRVRDYFVLNGLEAIPMSVAGYGASRPVADNKTAAGMAANRRVVVTVNRQQ